MLFYPPLDEEWRATGRGQVSKGVFGYLVTPKIHATSNIRILIRRTKHELIIKLITQMEANSRDESIIINLSLAHVHCSIILSNRGLIRLIDSSHKLAFIYVIGFVINLYLMFFINI